MNNTLDLLNKVMILMNIFAARSDVPNICHVNARSVSNKVHESNEMFSRTRLGALLVSETWLNGNIPSRLVSIDGFQIFRNDRVGTLVAVWLFTSRMGYLLTFSGV